MFKDNYYMERNQKIHTTNYFNTLIEPAEDCLLLTSSLPKNHETKKTIARHQFELISAKAYNYTSDDILFKIYAEKKDIIEEDLENERAHFFSKGQACLRCSPLTKQYAWGIHFDENGRVALYNIDSIEYQKFKNDATITKVKAMRSSKK